MKKPIQFGKYWLLDRVNVGGMAEVFRAKAFGVEGFERLLAVKRILPNIAADEEFISMFIDEAKIAVQLNHANICQIFDLGKVDGSYFIALEFVHGKDLRAIFDRVRAGEGGPAMPVAQACFIIMKACEGLDYAHNKRDPAGRELQLVHRDVSPQNILISYEGEVKLIDFGIAKAAGKASRTQQGILKGKFGYMSPEQVRGLPLDRRSDVFALGIVLYELLTGERLFVGESDFSTLEKVRNVEILPPSTYNRRIPDELERIVLRALTKDVDDRYQNAIDLHDDLQAFMYSAGEFYSRKELANWMKRIFAGEIEAETAKLEQYRQMALPTTESAPPAFTPSRRSASMPIALVPPPPPPRTAGVMPVVISGGRSSAAMAVAHPADSPPATLPDDAHGGTDLNWDDEEVATNIYEAPQDAGDAVVGDEPDTGRDVALPAVDPHEHHDLTPVSLEAPAMSAETTLPPITPPPAAPYGNGGAPYGNGGAAYGNGAAAYGNGPAPYGNDAPAPGRRRHGTPRQNPFAAAPARSSAAAMMTAPTPRRRSRSNLPYVLLGLGCAVLLATGFGVVYYVNRPGHLYLTSDPASNVQVLVDNKPQVDHTPATLRLEPASYVITVQREGYVPWSEQVDIKAGETLRRRAVLEPLASGTGFTVVSDPPGAQLVLDGRPLEGVTPLKVQSVMPGRHNIELRSPAGTWSQEVTLEAGKLLDVRARLVAPARPKPGRELASATAPKREPPRRVEPPKRAEPPAPAREPAVAKRPEPPAPAREPPREPVTTPKPLQPSSGTVAVKRPDPPAPTRELPAAKRPDPRTKVAVADPKRTRALPDEESDDAPAPRVRASADEGFLRLNSKPWTNIAIDGKDTGLHTPQTHLKLSAGSHRVTLTNEQFSIKETFSVEIRPGETETVIKDLRAAGADTD